MLTEEGFSKQQDVEDTLFLQIFDRHELRNLELYKYFMSLVSIGCVCPTCSVLQESQVYMTAHPSQHWIFTFSQRQISSYCKHSNFTTRLVEVQRQIGNASCGLFVYSHCCCLDPYSIQLTIPGKNFLICACG